MKRPRITDLPERPRTPDARARFLGRATRAGKEREWAVRLWDACKTKSFDPELVLAAILRGERMSQ